VSSVATKMLWTIRIRFGIVYPFSLVHSLKSIFVEPVSIIDAILVAFPVGFMICSQSGLNLHAVLGEELDFPFQFPCLT
jgi:hypothetical protein